MGTAKDLMESFLAAYPEIQNGKFSMEELNKLMEEHQRKLNSRPIKDFDGLSPEQMNFLLYAPLSPGGILQLKDNIDVPLQQVPFFKLLQILVGEIQRLGNLKLTVNGNLPVRICELLFHEELIYWPDIKFVKKITEDKIPYIWPLKQYLLDAGIVKKRNNHLSVTKYGEKMIKEPIAFQFRQVLNYFTTRFHWGNFYNINDDGQYGQLGWAYSLVLLARYGDQPQISNFYNLKLMQAFEHELWAVYLKNNTDARVKEFQFAYDVRFFENFSMWFGLVNIEWRRDHSISYWDQLFITKSALFEQLFEMRDDQ
jgi:hypothetical protein